MKVKAIVDNREFEVYPVEAEFILMAPPNMVGVPCVYVVGTWPPEVWPKPQEGVEIVIKEEGFTFT